jgi:hypothetical protein
MARRADGYSISITAHCSQCADAVVCPPDVSTKPDAERYALASGYGKDGKGNLFCPPDFAAYKASRPKPAPKKATSKAAPAKPKKGGRPAK